MKKTTLVRVLLCTPFLLLQGAVSELPLYPDAKTAKDPELRPVVKLYRPAKANSLVALVIFPGGGYWNLSRAEGENIGEWCAKNGITGAVVKYRRAKSGYHYPAPLADARRAIRLIRGKAAELGIAPDKIGVIGFSAGGHLAALVSTRFSEEGDSVGDALDRVSCRPDFSALIYPVIVFDKSYTHRGSQNNFLGKNATKEVIAATSPEKLVTKETPPAFLVHADSDKVVPAENSLDYYCALRRNGVPAELHVFCFSGHGFGLAPRHTGTQKWPELFLAWLKNMKFL